MSFQYLCFELKSNSHLGFQRISQMVPVVITLGTSVRIPLVFLTECHVTLTRGVIPEFLDATSD
jgi:hypothetical protein